MLEGSCQAAEYYFFSYNCQVLFVEDPLSGWVATVMENVGGRLMLRYDTPDCSGDTFWLFYQHPRLRPPDWIHQNGPMYKLV